VPAPELELWEVEVRIAGETVLTIGPDHYAGRELSEEECRAVTTCGEHLISFAGPPGQSAFFPDATPSTRTKPCTCSSHQFVECRGVATLGRLWHCAETGEPGQAADIDPE